MISVHCPVCSGPLHWHDETAEHLVGPSYADGQLAETLGRHLTQALWSAIRALEDSAAGSRWRLSQPNAPALLAKELDQLQHDIDVLRELVRSRAGQATPQTT
ncbi:hypothetical protein [Nocardioides pacificus]